MKYFIALFVLFHFLATHSILAQPTAKIISNDDAYCESGIATFKVEFTGTPPFSFDYKIGTSAYYEDGGGNIDTYTFERTFSPSETSTITLVKVYDSSGNYPPTGEGSTLVSGSMNIRVDQTPIPDAGSDQSVCGYEYQMKGKVEGNTTKVWWSDPVSVNNFSDPSSPTGTFTANNTGTYALTLNAENGTCKSSADVKITLKGRPTGTITNTDDWKFCSTDDSADELAINMEFTGNSAYTYWLKNNAGEKFGPFTTPDPSDNQAIQVSSTQTISFLSITDAQDCVAEAIDMQGYRTASDAKPKAFAGDDVAINCGDEYVLNATATFGAVGKWTSSSSNIIFADDALPNTSTTATFNGTSTYLDATHRWTVTDNELQCTNYDEINIRYVQKPTFTLNSKVRDTICDGESSFMEYTLSGSTPLSIGYRDHGSSFIKNNINSLTGTLELEPAFDINQYTMSTTEYTITQVSDVFNCTTDLNQKYTVTIDEMPTPYAGEDSYAPCVKTIELTADAPTVGSGEWKGPGKFMDKTDPNTYFTADHFDTNQGEAQTLTWTVKNGTCIASDELSINFPKAPYPVYAGNDTTIYAIDYIQLNAAQPDKGNNYAWSWIGENMGNIHSHTDPKSTLSDLDAGIYTLLWTVSLQDGNCPEKTDTLTITVKNLFSPTGISPNGDNINDFLEIKGAENISNDRLSVFNKNGKLVYSVNEYQNNWGGTDQGGSDLPSGTYFYIYEGDNHHTVKNYLIIKRDY